LSAKEAVPITSMVTTSPDSIPTRAAVPLKVAEVEASYTLLLAVKPEMVKPFGVISADNPVGCVKE